MLIVIVIIVSIIVIATIISELQNLITEIGIIDSY